MPNADDVPAALVLRLENATRLARADAIQILEWLGERPRAVAIASVAFVLSDRILREPLDLVSWDIRQALWCTLMEQHRVPASDLPGGEVLPPLPQRERERCPPRSSGTRTLPMLWRAWQRVLRAAVRSPQVFGERPTLPRVAAEVPDKPSMPLGVYEGKAVHPQHLVQEQRVRLRAGDK